MLEADAARVGFRDFTEIRIRSSCEKARTHHDQLFLDHMVTVDEWSCVGK